MKVMTCPVLRGPQGTLFGEGSIGGTPRYIPNRPDLSALGAAVEVSASDTHQGGGGYRVAAMMNVPLVAERLGMRMAVYNHEEAGFIDNVTLGLDDVNEASIDGRCLSLAHRVSDRLSFRAVYYQQETEMPGKPQYDPELGDLRQARNYEEALGDEFEMTNITLKYEADAFMVDSSTAWFERSVVNLRDVTPLVGLPSFLDDLTEFENFVQEVRVSSTGPVLGGRVDWLVGVFYDRRPASAG